MTFTRADRQGMASEISDTVRHRGREPWLSPW